MIEQLIKKENIVVNAHADSWQQAINLSLQQLVKNGYCTDEYETAVLKSTEENGFYYCLTVQPVFKVLLYHFTAMPGLHRELS